MNVPPPAAAAAQPGTIDLGQLMLAVALLVIAALLWTAFVARSYVQIIHQTLAGIWRQARAAAGLPEVPALARGGRWQVADRAQLVAAPNSRYLVRAQFVPDRSLASASVRAALRAKETWWSPAADYASNGERVAHTAAIVEVPCEPLGPVDLVAGQAIAWDLDFAIDGTVPPTCGRPESLSCEWALIVSVGRDRKQDAAFEQPIAMAQPRDRLMAGVTAESEWSRFEDASGANGPVSVCFHVRPVPLDLLAPAAAELTVTNAGPPIACQQVRLEMLMEATGSSALSDSWVIWQAWRAMSELPAGSTTLRFDIAAVSRRCPDADLPHGRLRGKLRLVVDRPRLPDLVISRDLCLFAERGRGA